MLKIMRGTLLICGSIFLVLAVAFNVCYFFRIGHFQFAFTLGQDNQDKPSPVVSSVVAEWSAISAVESDDENSRYKETVILINENGTSTTFGEVTVAPGEGVQFVHWVAAARKKDLADSISVEGVKGDVPVRIVVVKGTIKRDDLK